VEHDVRLRWDNTFPKYSLRLEPRLGLRAQTQNGRKPSVVVQLVQLPRMGDGNVVAELAMLALRAETDGAACPGGGGEECVDPRPSPEVEQHLQFVAPEDLHRLQRVVDWKRDV